MAKQEKCKYKGCDGIIIEKEEKAMVWGGEKKLVKRCDKCNKEPLEQTEKKLDLWF